MIWLAQILLTQAEPIDPMAWITHVAQGGGLVGTLAALYLGAERMGLLKRRDSDEVAELLRELVSSNKQIAACLDKLTDRQQDAHDLLIEMRAQRVGSNHREGA